VNLLHVLFYPDWGEEFKGQKNLDLGNGKDRRIIQWVKSERNGIFLKSEKKADDSP
jgi:hypothetical protein